MMRFSDSLPGSETELNRLLGTMPYACMLGIQFELIGDELTVVLPFRHGLVGNFEIKALHGGVTASLLEISARLEVAWRQLLSFDSRQESEPRQPTRPRLPRPISFSVDYLRQGRPVTSYARATVTRSGRRYATVQVSAWQGQRSRLFAQATGLFLVAGQHE
ncbi:MAG: PaaI family thioesterase [Rhodobacteraceae bacterium]|nr:PaaI family thioesterase [Paracoccaceae bacterium]